MNQSNSNRITLGMVGAYIGIVIRIVLSVVWYASQAWLGGLAITCILASWSRSFLTMHNTLPQSAHMVTRDLTGFTIFQVISLPLLVSSYPSTAVIAANILTGSSSSVQNASAAP